MENSFYINYMTRAYSSFLKSSERKNSEKIPKDFLENIEEKIAAAKAAGVDTVSTQDMTMDEYKQYIYDKISAIPIHPSQMQDSISIHISEKGFEAMKNDPEYEAWVLDYLKRDFAVNNPWAALCGGSYHVEYFGASIQEHLGQSWYAGYQNGKGASLFNEKSKDSFWERRMDREEQLKEQYEKLWEKRANARSLYQRQRNAELLARKAAYSNLLSSWNGEVPLAQAAIAYEANLLLGSNLMNL